ncbi:hypothetical protein AS19_09410 [Alcanivorax sp. NBRC 101098]|jgi:outer membrane murein-binding lipoprotein Lpp|uniref:hypothetical protein n=1 Tax=Alcanivorax sp. NBRC 101098 TaxID=1113728 RepID=UPI0004ABE679|nr:hypothetical protein [Alcanivorax sp. NBRC 101098]BAP13792.1 hypothetical protein AS19_09410 [Alcanivorax sp. NBRC 101098]
MDTEELQTEVEKLKAEVEKLRNKNAQILSEKKQAVGERDALREQVEAANNERDEAAQELNYIKVMQPRQALIEEVAVDGMAGPLWREINYHFDVVNVEGREMLHHKDGSPVIVAGEDKATGKEVPKPVAFDADGLDALYKADLIPGMGSMLVGSRASGGGATGGGSGHNIQSKTNSHVKGVGFGLR